MKTEDEIKTYIHEKTGYYMIIDETPINILKDREFIKSWGYSVWTHDLMAPEESLDNKPLGGVLLGDLIFKTKEERLQYLNSHLDDIVEKCKNSEIFYDFI